MVKARYSERGRFCRQNQEGVIVSRRRRVTPPIVMRCRREAVANASGMPASAAEVAVFTLQADGRIGVGATESTRQARRVASLSYDAWYSDHRSGSICAVASLRQKWP